MKGITDVDSPDHIVTRAIAAGADAAMVTTGLDRQLAAAGWIDAGVGAARVKEALVRATIFRERFATAVPDDDIDDTPARVLAAEIAERAVTHIGPRLLRLDSRVRVVTFGSAPLFNSDSENVKLVAAATCARGPPVADAMSAIS